MQSNLVPSQLSSPRNHSPRDAGWVSLFLSSLAVFDSLRPHGLQHTWLPCPSLSSWSFLKLISIESVMSSNYPIFCHPLLLLHSILSSIRVFSNDLTLCIRWPKYWSFSISPSTNTHSGLIGMGVEFCY